MKNANYSTVTERPGESATKEQLSMQHTRYELAATHCESKRVLEIACGTGMGLGYLAESASMVVGLELDADNIAVAHETYNRSSRVAVVRSDAHNLPFPNSSFDTIVMLEALYYLPCPRTFIAEARRVMTEGGTLILSTVNCEWGGFTQSPYSIGYYTATELQETLNNAGFDSRILVGYPDTDGGIWRMVVRSVRRWSVKLNLIPRTMQGKVLLKRLFYGRTVIMSRQLPRHPELNQLLIDASKCQDKSQYKILYAIGSKRGKSGG